MTEKSTARKPAGRPKKTTVTVTKTVTGLPVGRNNVVIDPQDVFKLAALGLKNKEIAAYHGVSEDAINSNFAAELRKGKEELKISLRRAMLHNACVNYNAAVQIFLAKNMLGMSDTPHASDEAQILPWSDSDDKPTATGNIDNTDNSDDSDD